MTEEEERQALVEQMLAATTTEEIAAAKRRAKAWLQRHPGDIAVLSAGEQLAMMEGALREIARRSA